MTDYLSWNQRLAEHFFRPEMSGRRVYLYVTEGLIEELGPPQWGGLPGFIGALRQGPPWVCSGGLCQRALGCYAGWRQRGLAEPPYIAYLAMSVLAAGLEGDFAPHAYYPRLRTLLGEPPHPGSYPGFHRMIELWFDLEQWSNEDKQGSLGLFSVTFAVNWPHVGIPTAQTLLTEHERHSLPHVFFQAGLDPTSPPSVQELSHALVVYGQHLLGHRTLRLLEQPAQSEGDPRRALLSIVLDELLAWDGTCPATEANTGTGAGVFAALRLCCDVDEVAARARFTVRCRTNHEFPEEGLALTDDSGVLFGCCEEYGRGWSLPLTDQSGKRIDAGALTWSSGLQLRDSGQQWRLVLPPSPVRIFVSGASEGIRGLVETRQLPRNQAFHLAVEDSRVPLVEKWGRSACERFRSVELSSGMPSGWHLFGAERALSDELVRKQLPALSFPREVRLSLEGGVKSAGTHQHFRFAPPSVRMEGASSSTEVFCNAVRMDGESGLYRLGELPDANTSKVTVEAKDGAEVVARQVIYLVDSLPWPPVVPAVRFDPFGNLAKCEEPNTPGFTGVLVTGFDSPPMEVSGVLPPHAERLAYLVGPVPGQIVLWPEEPAPESWEPVWLVPRRLRGEVLFCGRGVAEAAPVQNRTSGSQERVYRWKEVLWRRRHCVVTPSHRSLKRLWEDYERIASRAF